jgi:hypothetical protein
MASSRRKVVVVRRSTLERNRMRRLWFALFRFMLYGFIGLSAEVIFYNLVKFGRRIPGLELLFQFKWKVDERLNLDAVWDAPLISLYGQCSLWMFLVYAVASVALIEPLYRRSLRWPLAARAVLYGVGILGFEALSGWLLFWGTGYRIWYYDDRFNIVGMTSLYILPIWMITGLIVELVYRELMDPAVVVALESPLPQVQR